MVDFQQQLVLAIDAGAIGTVIMVVIAIISWIANLSGANQQKTAPARPPRRRPKLETPDDEAEQFRRAKAREIQEVHLDDEIEVVSEPRRRPPRRRRPPARQNRAVNQRKSPPQQPVRPTRPGEGLSKRPDPFSGDLGAGLQQHVAEYMDEHISEKVQASGANVEASVRQHFSERIEAPEVVAEEDHSQFGAFFRDPARLREAIIMNEIFAPPKSLR